MTMTADERAFEITGGRPAENVFAYRIAEAIRAAEQEAENRGYLRGVQDMTEGAREAEQRGAERICAIFEQYMTNELSWNDTIEAIRARGKQTEPA